MIGNDIIDMSLAKSQSNWERNGWVDKIFVKSEQEFIYTSSDPTKMVWKLWSMKEAAYKAHQRRFSFAPIYNPKSFVCTNDSVMTNGYMYTTKSKSEDSYIYTLAQSDKSIYKTVTYYKDVISIKKRLQEYVAVKYGVKAKDITLVKNVNKIPNVLIHNEQADIQFSLTAHGNFSAFILRL